MGEPLTAKTCVPCQGGIPPLTQKQAEAFMEQVPGWRLAEDGTRIILDAKFVDFAEALGFVDRVGALAEQEFHHPDIEFGWGYARVTLFTHKIKGLHENDFILAAKINGLRDG